jgi:hypothetical protein
MAEQTTTPRYEPFGWHHWPEHFWMSYQLRRGLGETQEGGGAVSEVLQAASRMKPGDAESWHEEWMRIALRNDARGDSAAQAGHMRSAMNCWLRAANYFREAEFWLKPDDPRRLATFGRCEAASQKWLVQLEPPGEVVDIPYLPGTPMPAYFIKSPCGGAKQPVLISVGGLDSFKDELWFMTGRGAVQRGMSVLLVDGPGQGGTLRRHGIPTRHDYEVPIGKCLDTDGRTPWDDHKQLLSELKLYEPVLLEKPRLVVANKMDEPSAEANLKSFKRRVRKTPVIPISAAFDEGIEKFKALIRAAVEETETAAR